MNTVSIDQRNFKFPSTWNELTREQLLYISKEMMWGGTDLEKKIRIVLYFLNLRKSILAYQGDNYLLTGKYRYFKWLAIQGIRKGKVKQIADEDVFFLASTMDFLFNKVDLTAQILPVIKAKKTFYGPAARFGNLSLIEFAKADARFRYYVSSENPMYLNEMIAILYRPAKKGIRTQYQDECIKNARYFEKIDMSTRMAVSLYWQGCYNYLINTFPNVFTGTSDDGDGFGFGGMITELAGEKFGTIDKTAETNLISVLIYLERLAIQQSKIKK